MQSEYPTRHLDLISPSGERTSLSAVFGPIYSDGNDFRCKITLTGSAEFSRDIWGYDSLQAFTLALQLYYSILRDHLDRGDRIVWPGTDENYELEDRNFKNTNAAEQGAAANP